MYIESKDSPPVDACHENIDSDDILLEHLGLTQLLDVIAELKPTREALRLSETRLESLVREARRKFITTLELGLDDNVTGVLNISEHTRIETTLSESEQQFRTLTENSPNLIIRYDRECRRIYVNPAYILAFGIPAYLAQNVTLDTQWLTNMNISAEEYKAKLRQVMETGNPDEILLEWERKDSSYVTSHLIHLVAEKAASGRVIGCLAIGHNISRLKATEFKLVKLAETSPGVMFTYLLKPDGTSCMPYVSPRIMELTGLSREIIAEGLSGAYTWIHPDDQSRVVKSIEDSARSLSTWRAEFRFRHPTKGEVWVEGRSTPVAQPDGSIQCYGFFHDINERKNTEKQLFEKQEQLAAMAINISLAEERERRRIAAVLHDHVGQILFLCKIKLGTLDKSFEGSSDEGTYHEIQEYLAQTINDVRSLTQQLSPLLLAEVEFEAAIKLLIKKIEKDYFITVDFSDDGSVKPLNEEIRAVVFQSARELLINVAKHARTNEARLSIGREGDMLVLMVEDQGRGFACLLNPSTNILQDCSFGLFNIWQRIKQLGGELRIDSAPEQGTCATIRVPLTDG